MIQDQIEQWSNLRNFTFLETLEGIVHKEEYLHLDDLQDGGAYFIIGEEIDKTSPIQAPTMPENSEIPRKTFAKRPLSKEERNRFVLFSNDEREHTSEFYFEIEGLRPIGKVGL